LVSKYSEESLVSFDSKVDWRTETVDAYAVSGEGHIVEIKTNGRE
jgi:hypothetical protein